MEGQEGTGLLLSRPDAAIVEGGEWLVASVEKIWTGRNSRRGVVDPSGGITLGSAYGSEILVVFPLVDDPKTPQPEGTLTLSQIEERILGPLVRLNEKLVDKPKDF